ncbi:MAG: GAF domain-containing protein [Deltaproteobacteria bacterium]|nr:GAF domain-containing protein [Deltaproteobacteria bacterium]
MEHGPAPIEIGHRATGGRLAQGCAVLSGGVALIAGLGWLLDQWRFATFGPDYIPMAPLTAWLLVLLGAAVLLRARWPARAVTRALGLVAVIAVALCCAWALAALRRGAAIPLEQRLAPVVEQVRGIPVGRMSPLTAITFLAAALALLLTLGPFAERRLWRRLGAGFGAATLAIGSVVIVSYAADAPLLYGTGTVPMALTTAIAFVALAAGLLLVTGAADWWAGALPRRLIALLGALVLALVVGGTWLYRSQRGSHQREAAHGLQAILRLKADQIAAWRAERLGDAAVLMDSPFLAEAVPRWLETADPAARERLQDRFRATQQARRYHDVLLVDGGGQVRLSVRGGPSPLPADTLAALARARRERQPVLADLHAGPAGGSPQLDVVVPLRADGGGAAAGQAALVLRVDARASLYPLVQAWPVSSPTAEALLVRRDGDHVRYLSDLRHGRGAALALRVPVTRVDMPVVMAVRGRQGAVLGRDYRGVKVLAVMTAVPDSPWFLVAKVDQEEVFAPLRQRAWTTGVIVALLILAATLAVGVSWQQQSARSLQHELQAERARKTLAERIAHLTRYANDIILFTDDDWRILEANDRAVAAYGCTHDELRRLTLRDLRAPEGRDAFDRDARQVAEQDGLLVETVHRRRDGSTFPVESSMRTVELDGARFHQAIVRDIGERRQAEARLRRLNRALRTISQCNQVLVRATDEAALLHAICRTMVEVGGYRMSWVGYAETDEGKTVRAVAQAGFAAGYLEAVRISWADTERGRGPTGRAIREGAPALARDLLADPACAPWRAEAERCGYRSSGAFPLVAEGRAFGALMVYATEPDAFDDDEVKLLVELADDLAFGIASLRARAERAGMQAQLVVADRMASVGTLAAGVAHEINNPLAYVVSNLDFLGHEIAALGAGLPAGRLDDVTEALRDASEGAGRVRRIVRDLRIFSRADEVRRGPVELRPVLESCLSMAWNEIRHRAHLVKDYGEAPLVEASESRLGQVFLNLIVNAAHAIPVGDADRNQIRIVTRTDAAGRAVVEVRDTGTGIAPAHRARIFDPFFPTTPAGVGTGLGLSICSTIVAALGGEIGLESAVGQGSTFTVTLPAASGPPTEPAGPPAAPRPGRRGRVLVLDDEPSVGAAIRRSLACDHEVVVLTDGRQALARLEAGETFDAIICDLMMPEMTGMEFHAALCQRRPDLVPRVILLTAGAFTPGAREFLERATNPRIEKPFDADELRALVRTVVG